MKKIQDNIVCLIVTLLMINVALANRDFGDQSGTLQNQTLVALSAQYLNGDSVNNQIVIPKDEAVDVDLDINVVNRNGLGNGTLSINYKNCDRCFAATIESMQINANTDTSFQWTPRVTFNESMLGRGNDNVIYVSFEDRYGDIWESSPIQFSGHENGTTGVVGVTENLLIFTGQYTDGEPVGNHINIPENGSVQVNLTASLTSTDSVPGTLSIRYRSCPSCTASVPLVQVSVPSNNNNPFVFPVPLELSDVVFDTGYQLFAEYATQTSYRISTAIAITVGDEDDFIGFTQPLPVNNYQWSGGHGIAHRWGFADIFGTGQELYVTQNDEGQFFATQLNNDGSFQNYQWNGGHGIAHRWFFADILGNGRQLFVTHRNDGTFFATQLNQDGTLENYLWSGGHEIAHHWSTADLFGTGQKLYVTYRNDGTFFATQLNADGTLNNYQWSGGNVVGDQWWFVDISPGGPEMFVTHYHNGSFLTTQLNSDGSLNNTQATGGVGTSSFSEFINLHPDDPFGTKSYVTVSHGYNLVFTSQFSPDLGNVNNQGGGFQYLPDIETYNRFVFTDFLGTGRKGFFVHDDDGHMLFFEMTAAEPGHSLDIQTYIISNGHGISHRWALADIFGNGKKVYVTHHDNGTFYATEANN